MHAVLVTKPSKHRCAVVASANLVQRVNLVCPAVKVVVIRHQLADLLSELASASVIAEAPASRGKHVDQREVL